MAKVVGSNTSSEVLAIEEFPVMKKTTVEKKDPVPVSKPSVPPIMDSLSLIQRKTIRTKPVYADTWTVGDASELQKLEGYETDAATIIIGTADDGEIEYNIVPNEYTYPPELDSIIEGAIDSLRNDYRKNGGRMDRIRALSAAEEYIWGYRDVISSLISQDCDIRDAIEEMSEVVYRYTIGNGIFDVLLADQRLEDIYVDAPCEKNRIHVTLNNVNGSNSHVRCRTNLICDQKEMRNLITMLMRELISLSILKYRSCPSGDNEETSMYANSEAPPPSMSLVLP